MKVFNKSNIIINILNIQKGIFIHLARITLKNILNSIIIDQLIKF